ncbi:MAG: hypothetical protein NWE95_07195 [Candidatus Bathyarchaeota archaeon]|nr:hypothetical protein [Candidatus Bathyarchaeota archaeon]
MAKMLELMMPTTRLIANSTPLVDLYDMKARWGVTSRGPFKGCTAGARSRKPSWFAFECYSDDG